MTQQQEQNSQQQKKRKKILSQQQQQEQVSISDIDLRIQELANEIVSLEHEEGEIRHTKKLRYREMAYHLKEKYLMLNQPEKIRDICSEISR